MINPILIHREESEAPALERKYDRKCSIFSNSKRLRVPAAHKKSLLSTWRDGKWNEPHSYFPTMIHINRPHILRVVREYMINIPPFEKMDLGIRSFTLYLHVLRIQEGVRLIDQ